jgi:histidine phosphotransferase ChpT
LSWPAGQPDDALAGRFGLGRLLLNLVMLAVDTLPQGGVITLAAQGTVATGRAAVSVSGRGVKWSAETAAALGGAAVGATAGARALQAAITARFAAQCRIAVDAEAPDGETLTLRLVW